jgi:hypothetical protein
VQYDAAQIGHVAPAPRSANEVLMRASKLQPALLGGLVIGVLSALPVISMGNCLCCAWVILGGMTATYLLQQAQPGPVEAADGAIAGLLAGLFGAVVGSLVSIPIQMLMGPMNGDLLRRILEQGGSDMPGEMRTTIESLTRGGVGGALMIVGLVTSLFVNAIFGAIGGLLGTVIFKPSMPPPPPPVPGFADPARPHGPEL